MPRRDQYSCRNWASSPPELGGCGSCFPSRLGAPSPDPTEPMKLTISGVLPPLTSAESLQTERKNLYSV